MNMYKIVNWKTPKYMTVRISSQEEGYITTVRLWNTMKQELREEKTS